MSADNLIYPDLGMDCSEYHQIQVGLHFVDNHLGLGTRAGSDIDLETLLDLNQNHFRCLEDPAIEGSYRHLPDLDSYHNSPVEYSRNILDLGNIWHHLLLAIDFVDY